MATFILPSKLVAERITVWFPFQTELGILEEVTAWSVEIETLVGIDPEPELLLYGVAALDGQEVSQQVEAGVPGVTYQLRCEITTNLGQIVQHLAKLAILPSPTLVPDLLATWYTTELYPLDHNAYIEHGMDSVEGRLRPQPFPLESIVHAMAPDSGTLVSKLVEFDASVESIDHLMAAVDGTLESKLVTYALNENAEHSMNAVDGTLVSKLVSYGMNEQIEHSMAFVSGTLT